MSNSYGLKHLKSPVILAFVLICLGLSLFYVLCPRYEVWYGFNNSGTVLMTTNVSTNSSPSTIPAFPLSPVNTTIGTQTLGSTAQYSSDNQHSQDYDMDKDFKEKSQVLETDQGRSFNYSLGPGGSFQVGDEDIYIYSAFLDTRFKPHSIRMFGMQSQAVTSLLRCLFTFPNGTQLVASEGISEAIFPDWPTPKVQYLAYYYSCKLPTTRGLTDDVALELSVNGSGLRARVPWTEIGMVPDKDRGTLALCVKAVWGRLDSRRLVEWIETNRELGVQKIVFYDRTVVGPSQRVLQYYSQRSLVEIIPYIYALAMASLMNDDPMRLKLKNEGFIMEQGYLVSINDCYYRLRDRYKYVLLIDIDEILVPVKNETFHSLIFRAKNYAPTASSFVFPMAWHFGEYDESTSNESIPQYMYMQRHLRRTQIMNPANDQPKAILDTDGVLTLNWHGGVKIPEGHGYEGNLKLKWSDYGFLHHFRESCEDKYNPNECNFMKDMSEIDKSIPRLAKASMRVKMTLQELQLL